MSVRDADGKALGRIRRCYPWGFEVTSGLFGRREWVLRYDEVLELAAGEVRVARSDAALLELAAGGLPRAWRQVTPAFGGAPLPSAPAEGDVEGALVEEREPPAARRPDPRPAAPPVVQAAPAHGPG